MIAEKKFKEADAVAAKAAAAFARSGNQCLLADALITQGIACARGGKPERAQLIMQKAIEVAVRVDASSKAGLAALALIEEVHELSPAMIQAAYERARGWLADCQSRDVLSRLNQAAGKLVLSVRLSTEDANEILLTRGCDFQQGKLNAEREMIRQALARSNGRITQAASLLGLSYQALAYIIQTRQKELLKERTPVRRRLKKQNQNTRRGR